MISIYCLEELLSLQRMIKWVKKKKNKNKLFPGTKLGGGGLSEAGAQSNKISWQFFFIRYFHNILNLCQSPSSSPARFMTLKRWLILRAALANLKWWDVALIQATTLRDATEMVVTRVAEISSGKGNFLLLIRFRSVMWILLCKRDSATEDDRGHCMKRCWVIAVYCISFGRHWAF